MHLDQAQAIVRARTSYVAISLRSLTESMADLDLRWVAQSSAHGLEVKIFSASSDVDQACLSAFISSDYHVTHALTQALAEWFVLHSRD